MEFRIRVLSSNCGGIIMRNCVYDLESNNHINDIRQLDNIGIMPKIIVL